MINQTFIPRHILLSKKSQSAHYHVIYYSLMLNRINGTMVTDIHLMYMYISALKEVVIIISDYSFC
jgi:DNA-binding MurR/RpiR family transcriptional regulator